MYTSNTSSARTSSSRKGSFRGRSSSSAPRSRFGSRGGSSQRAFNPKKGFKAGYIDERLFINLGAQKGEVDTYTSKHTFADFAIDAKLAENLTRKKFESPSPIQDQAIPVALEGRDVIGIASTGTGKTAAFLIPLINKLVSDKEHKVLILTPTRELALQVEEHFVDLTKNMSLFSVTCVGGSPIYRQIKELELGVHVIVGTPGRVRDLIDRGKINMKYFESVVLDEADRMLDMGFIDDMRAILLQMPESKQGLFFSATFSKEIQGLCHEFLKSPVTITIKPRDTSSSVHQDVIRVTNQADKLEKLIEIISKEGSSKVLVFRETKRSVDDLADMLSSRGVKAIPLHGDMYNRDRERAVKDFASGRAHVLIATDVAARGIDINDITHVINYDIPSTYETYVHRIGRTGRGTKLGTAYTFVSGR